jgi:hypothetical protein
MCVRLSSTRRIVDILEELMCEDIRIVCLCSRIVLLEGTKEDAY